MNHLCRHCGKVRGTDGPGWCPMRNGKMECLDAWKLANPEEAKGWVKVEDLTVVQRAELDGILGLGGKA